jgi:hypothetical protein
LPVPRLITAHHGYTTAARAGWTWKLMAARTAAAAKVQRIIFDLIG